MIVSCEEESRTDFSSSSGVSLMGTFSVVLEASWRETFSLEVTSSEILSSWTLSCSSRAFFYPEIVASDDGRENHFGI